MKLLLDTPIALWALSDDPRLTAETRELMCATDNRIWVSVASMWEVAIKRAIKPDKRPLSGVEFLHYCEQAGYESLPLRERHVAALESLPAIHADPFDRILIAQAQAEALVFLTHDAMLAGYGGQVRLVSDHQATVGRGLCGRARAQGGPPRLCTSPCPAGAPGCAALRT